MLKITKKRTELFKFLSNLDTLNSLKGVKFAYSISLIKSQIKKEVKIYKELSEPSEEIVKFNAERVELVKEYSEKDEAGNPKISEDGREYVIDETKKEEFQAQFNELKEKYSIAVKEQEDKNKELIDFLNEEITIEVRPISLDILPEEISVEQLEILEEVIEK